MTFQLPSQWENALSKQMNMRRFYQDLNDLLTSVATIIPKPSKIFNAFTHFNPNDVKVVLYGEDPYPRPTSANGVAFWDEEIKYWTDKTNGNSLKNILKALLVHKNMAVYQTQMEQCRKIALEQRIPQPPQLFKSWLSQGVLLINTSMTFSAREDKKKHFLFWMPFHLALIKALNRREQSPVYILWGKKAQNWKFHIVKTIDDKAKIIEQGHPTFIHQFLNKADTKWSPFDEIANKTTVQWIKLR
jgi:uracil-DNA glycosylase